MKSIERIAYFDCQYGAAGDMLLGAMLDSGLNEGEFLNALNGIALPADSFSLQISKQRRCSIEATKFHVGVQDLASHEHGHSHDHEHEHRHLSEVLHIISRSEISVRAKDLASAVFKRLARAEAKVHGVSVEEVAFHEVGAIDAIIDIVGFAIAFDLLKIDRAYVSALPLGRGCVNTQHGIFPVPAPAVVQILQEAGAVTSSFDIPYECLTPTGAAILCQIASEWVALPAFSMIEGSGFGAGTKDTTDWPNVVRVMWGQALQPGEDHGRFLQEEICQIEAALDDCSPQTLAYAVDKIMEGGALDCTVIPATMKKGRSGAILSVLSRPNDACKIQELILVETSSLGVRLFKGSRMIAEREMVTVSLDSGHMVRLKLGKDKLGKILNVQPEFEDCRKVADEAKLPLKLVTQQTLEAFSKINSKGKSND